MQNYLINLLAAAIAAGVAELLPLDGENDRPLRLITALLILCTIALPLLDAAGLGSDGLLARLDDWRDTLETVADASEQYAAEAMAQIREVGAEAAAEEIVALLAERFGLSSAYCRAEVTLGDDGAGGIALVGVKVYLRGPAILADAATIEDYLAALFGGQVIVVIE